MSSTELGASAPAGAVDATTSRLWASRLAAAAPGQAPSVGASAPGTSAPAGDAAPVSVATSISADAGPAPIDTDRVAMIRKAVETGTYPLVPAKISDAMIAAGILLRTADHGHA